MKIKTAFISLLFLAKLGSAQTADLSCLNEADFAKVYVAQTHVLEPTHEYFKLVADREALIKVNLPKRVSTNDKVHAVLSLGGRERVIPLQFADTDFTTNQSFNPCGFGKNSVLNDSFEHVTPFKILSDDAGEKFVTNSTLLIQTFDNSFTGYIPKEWVKPSLKMTIVSGSKKRSFDLEVGAENKLKMVMFTVDYMDLGRGDQRTYPDGWQQAYEARHAFSDIDWEIVPKVIFNPVTIPPRDNLVAAKVHSKQEYILQGRALMVNKPLPWARIAR